MREEVKLSAAQERLRAKKSREARAERVALDEAHQVERDRELLSATWTAAQAKAGIDVGDLTSDQVDVLAEALRIMQKPDPLKAPSGQQRQVSLRLMSSVRDDVPLWAWQPKPDYGAVAVGTMVILGGRPGAGKTTCARWLVAQATTGTLPGTWHGMPVSAAWIGTEESESYVIKPGLRAAGADLDKVVIPEMQFEHDTDGVVTVPFLQMLDMAALADALKKAGVRVVVLDPMMSVIGAKTDVYRSNEVRARLEPWVKLAEDIDGIVVGVAHLKKNFSGDVVAALNGSSAFGEVARSIFGFAKDPESEDGERIMSHAKNSLGPEDLSHHYRLEPVEVVTDSGKTATMATFVLGEETDRTVSDAMREIAAGPQAAASDRPLSDKAVALRHVLTGDNGEALEVLKDTAMEQMSDAGFSPDQTRRAREELAKRGLVATPYRKEVPGPYYWRLMAPGSEEDGNSPPRPRALQPEGLPSCHPVSDQGRQAAILGEDGKDGSLADTPREDAANQSRVPALHAVPDETRPTCRQWLDTRIAALIDSGATTASSAEIYNEGQAAGYRIDNLRQAASKSGLIAIARKLPAGGAIWNIGVDAQSTAVPCSQWIITWLRERGEWVSAGEVIAAGEAAGYGRTAIKSASLAAHVLKRGQSTLTEWRLDPEYVRRSA